MKQESTRKRLGGQLMAARHGMGWKLNELGQRTANAPSRLSNIERGKINATVDALAQAGEAAGLSLTFVPTERLEEVLALLGQTEPKTRYSAPVSTVYDELFIPDPSDEEIEDEDGAVIPHARP
jgi:transcriptional regulator with XRE-family HTH domain